MYDVKDILCDVKSISQSHIHILLFCASRRVICSVISLPWLLPSLLTWHLPVVILLGLAVCVMIIVLCGHQACSIYVLFYFESHFLLEVDGSAVCATPVVTGVGVSSLPFGCNKKPEGTALLMMTWAEIFGGFPGSSGKGS